MSSLPMILGLDVSKTRTGACWGRPGEAPRFASIAGAGVTDAQALSKLGRWLIEFTKLERVDAAFLEAQLRIIPSDYDEEEKRIVPKGNPNTVIALAKMVGACEFVFNMRSVELRTPAVRTVRKVFLGNGGLQKEEAEIAVRSLCASLGWSPSNHDEADAAAVWFYGCIQVKPHAATVITPMMQQRAVSIASQRIPGGLYAPA